MLSVITSFPLAVFYIPCTLVRANNLQYPTTGFSCADAAVKLTTQQCTGFLTSDESHARVATRKVHSSVLPIEYDLARMVSKVKNLSPSWRVERSANTWDGIVCDVDGSVTRIHWSDRNMAGELLFSYLPRTLEELRMNTNTLIGRCDIPHDCRGLTSVDVSHNELSEIDISLLPGSVTYLELSSNLFHGLVDFEALPEMLRNIHLANNKFVGPVSLVSLPNNTRYIYLDFNSFEGPLDLTCLPSKFNTISAYDNRLNGELNISQLPRSTRQLALAKNQFQGTIDLSYLPPLVYYVSFFGNNLTVYMDTSKFSENFREFCISYPPRRYAKVTSLPGMKLKWHGNNNTFYGLQSADIKRTKAALLIEQELEWKPIEIEIATE